LPVPNLFTKWEPSHTKGLNALQSTGFIAPLKCVQKVAGGWGRKEIRKKRPREKEARKMYKESNKNNSRKETK